MKETQTLWQSVLENIQKEVDSPVIYSTWYSVINPYAITETTFYLEVEMETQKNMLLRDRYMQILKDGIQKTTGKSYEIVIFMTREKETMDLPVPEAEETAAPAAANKHFIMPLNPSYTFENFVVSNSNSFIHSACFAVALAPAEAYNPLFLYGGVGLGKTHLAQAIAHQIQQDNPESKIVYITSEKFTSDLVLAIQNKTIENFRKRYRTADVLIIDDIQFIAGKESTQEEFFHTFNELHQAGKQIVITSDRPPKDLSRLEERLRSRFGWGLIADIQPPDFETRLAILKKKLQSFNISLSDDILSYIAETVNSNIRDLEGVMTKINATITLNGCEISMSDIKKIIAEISPYVPADPTPDTVKMIICRDMNISLDDLLSSKKTKPIANARQLGMYFCRELLRMPYAEVALAFGKKDHTTAINAYEKVYERRQTDKSFDRLCVALQNTILNAIS